MGKKYHGPFICGLKLHWLVKLIYQYSGIKGLHVTQTLNFCIILKLNFQPTIIYAYARTLVIYSFF